MSWGSNSHPLLSIFHIQALVTVLALCSIGDNFLLWKLNYERDDYEKNHSDDISSYVVIWMCDSPDRSQCVHVSPNREAN